MQIKTLGVDGLKYHWQWYKHFFSLNYLRYFGTWFAISPIVATITENSSGANKICIGSVCAEYSVSLPFTWWLLWLGSLFFIIAFSLYQIYCPKFIKDYSSYSDYERARHSPRWAAWEALYLVKDAQKSATAYDLDKFVSRLLTKKYAQETDEKTDEPRVDVIEEQSVLKFVHGDKSYELAMPRLKKNADGTIEIDDVATYEVVWEVFGRRASSYPNIRKTIYWLINLAWTTVIIVIIQNIITTASLLYNQLST